MQFFVHDRFTVVSYCIMKSPVFQSTTPKRVIFFLPDIFESFIEYMDMFLEIIEGTTDTILILGSYPGRKRLILKV